MLLFVAVRWIGNIVTARLLARVVCGPPDDVDVVTMVVPANVSASRQRYSRRSWAGATDMHCWRNGSRRADGRCMACSRLMTLSTACSCWSSPTVINKRDDQSPGSHDDADSSNASRNSSLLSAHSNGGTTEASSCSRRVSSDDLTAASSVLSADECIVVEEMDPSCQSSVHSTVGKQSLDSHARQGCNNCSVGLRDNQPHLPVRRMSSSELSLRSAKGSSSNDDERCLMTCQSSVISSCQSSLLSTVAGQSLDSRTMKDYCKLYQGFCASARDSRQHTNHRNTDEAADDMSTSSRLHLRKVSSSEASLLSAKGSGSNNDDWRLITYACRLNGVVAPESLRQSLDSHTAKDDDKAHQRVNVSSALDNGQHSSARQVSSSELSLLSAKGSIPDNVEWWTTTSTYQPRAIGSGKFMDSRQYRRQSSLFGDVGKQTTPDDRKAHQEFNVNSSHHNRQRSNWLNVNESADTVSTSTSSHVDSRRVSSSEASLLSAKGSSPDNEGWPLTTDDCQSSDTGSSSITVWNPENLNSTCNCRRIKQMLNRSAHLGAIQSAKRLATRADSRNEKDSQTNCIPNSHSSSREAMLTQIEEGCKPHHMSDDSEEMDADAEEKSESADLLLRNGNVVYCCDGQCSLHRVYEFVPRDCDTCYCNYYRKLENEDIADDAAMMLAESQSTSSERGELQADRGSRADDVSDDDISSTASVTSTDRVSQTSVSDDDVDGKCRRELTAENTRGITDEGRLCPNCYRSDYAEPTTDEAASDSESTDESEVSTDNDKQDEEQQSSTDGDRSDASTADRHRDTASRCDKTAATDSDISTSMRSDVTSRCDSRVSIETGNVGRQASIHRQRTDEVEPVTKSSDERRYDDYGTEDNDTDGEYHGVLPAEHRNLGAQCGSVPAPCVQRTDSRTTEMTSASRSCTDAASDSDDTEVQSVDETCSVPGEQCQVTTASTIFFTQ